MTAAKAVLAVVPVLEIRVLTLESTTIKEAKVENGTALQGAFAALQARKAQAKMRMMRAMGVTESKSYVVEDNNVVAVLAVVGVVGEKDRETERRRERKKRERQKRERETVFSSQ